MNREVLGIIFWVLAAVFLLLYLKRRGARRKKMLE